MNQPIDDILLTSYALGEIEETDRARIEAHLAARPEARARVEEMRSLAKILSAEFAAETLPGLDPARRAEIEAAAGVGGAPRGRLLRLDSRPFAAAAAVILALGGAIGFGLGGPRTAERGSATERADLEAANRDSLNSRFMKRDQSRALPIDGEAVSKPAGEPALEASKAFLEQGEAGQSGFSIESFGVDIRGLGGTDPGQVALLDDVHNGRDRQPMAVNHDAATALVPGAGVLVTTPPVGGGHSAGFAPGSLGTIGPGPGPSPGAAGGGTGGNAGGGAVGAPGGNKPLDARSNNDTIGLGGGAGGSFAGRRGEESKAPASASGEAARRKSVEVGQVVSPANPGAPAPDTKASPERSAGAGLAAEVERLEAELHRLEQSGVNLPPVRRLEVKKLADEVRAHNGELSAKDESLRELRPADAAKEKLLEEQKKALVEEVSELNRKYERLRRSIDDEMRRNGNEDYSSVIEQPFKLSLNEPLSTIGLDIDSASYANLRRFLTGGQWPPRDAIRVDEMVNYFHYTDAAPTGEENLAIHAEVASCPWNMDNRLLRVAFKAKEIDRGARGATSLVFLVDVSGSMRSDDKLPLLKEGLKKLTQQLGEDDSVAIVTYASGVRVALEPTFGNDQSKILGVLDSLNAGGSTNGAGGIQTAYEVAQKSFVSSGTNRVILCTDGDFNVGVSDTDELTRMIEDKAKTGVFLSVLGFGTGNLKDGRMQAIANKGNGHYAYIDSKREAEKVLVEELVGTLMTVAKDAKLQIEFNPAEVASWRLLGYSARILQAQDFNDDKKDAGEIGAGHSVVALYELRTTHGQDRAPSVDPLKYQGTVVVENKGAPGELGTVKLRYKMPDADQSRLRTVPVIDSAHHYGQASLDFKLSASVALFGQILSRSDYVGQTGLAAAEELAQESIGADNDPRGLRRELVELIKKARAIIAPQESRDGTGAER